MGIWVYGRNVGWIDGHVVNEGYKEAYRSTDRQLDRQTNRHRQKQKHRQGDKFRTWHIIKSTNCQLKQI